MGFTVKLVSNKEKGTCSFEFNFPSIGCFNGLTDPDDDTLTPSGDDVCKSKVKFSCLRMFPLMHSNGV